MDYAIVATTIPCLRPFLTATGTNYGAPAQTRSSPCATGTAPSDKGFVLSSSWKMSTLGRSEQKAKALWASTKNMSGWVKFDNQPSAMSPDDQHNVGI